MGQSVLTWHAMAWQLFAWHRLPPLFGKQHTAPGQSSGPSQANPCDGQVPVALQTFTAPMQHSCWPSVHVVAPHAGPAAIAASIIGPSPAGGGASFCWLSSPPPPPPPPHATSAIAITRILSMCTLRSPSIGDPGRRREPIALGGGLGDRSLASGYESRRTARSRSG